MTLSWTSVGWLSAKGQLLRSWHHKITTDHHRVIANVKRSSLVLQGLELSPPPEKVRISHLWVYDQLFTCKRYLFSAQQKICQDWWLLFFQRFRAIQMFKHPPPPKFNLKKKSIIFQGRTVKLQGCASSAIGLETWGNPTGKNDDLTITLSCKFVKIHVYSLDA